MARAKQIPIKVTPEEAARIARQYSIHTPAEAWSRGDIRAKVSPGVEHFIFPHSKLKARHAVTGIIDHPRCGRYRVAYICLNEGDSLQMVQSYLHMLGQSVTFTGPSGVIQRLPKKLEVAEEVLFQTPRLYVGFDWLELAPAEQPTLKQIEEAFREDVIRQLDEMQSAES